MFPIFQSTDAVLAVILCLVAFAFWAQRFKPCKMIGPALIVIILGILLVNLKIVPESSEVYGTLSTYCIPISMSLYLMNVDLKSIIKMSKQPFIAIFCAFYR